MTTAITRDELIAALRVMVRKLNAAVESNEWNLETVRILDLAEEIGDWLEAWKADKPRVWQLPAEPTCKVTDSAGWVWEPTDDPDAPWQSGRICTTWPMVLTRGPLTEIR